MKGKAKMVKLYDCPCNKINGDCERRTPTCHSTCKDYIDWKREWDGQKTNEYAQRKNEYILGGVKER